MRHVLYFSFLILFVISPCASWSAVGDLDGSFHGGMGFVTTDFVGSEDVGNALVLQDDGMIVVAGRAYNGSDHNIALARYDSSGYLDASFGDQGLVVTDIENSHQMVIDACLQPDGKILVAGYHQSTNNDVLVARYTSAGELDSTFGVGGVFALNGPGDGHDSAYEITLLKDGRIYLVGSMKSSSGGTDHFLARITSDGSLDPTFNGIGYLLSDLYSSINIGTSLAVQDDGKILVGGYFYGGSGPEKGVFVNRYNDDGSLDATFNGSGITSTTIGTNGGSINDLILQSDGKIVGIGGAYTAAYDDFGLIRFNSDGSIDSGFGTDGKVITDINSSSNVALGGVLQLDGKIIAAGHNYNGSDTDLALIRYNTDGSIDPNFNGTGILTTNIGNDDDAGMGVTLDVDRKILVAGYSRNDNGFHDFVLARYLGDPFSMINPNGGESFDVGSTYTVQWNADPDAVRYRLHYFDADSTPHVVANVGNVTSYEWQIPLDALPESGKLFRVTAFDAADVKLGEAWSNGTFTVVLQPLVVLSPANGETWTVDSTYTLQWTPHPDAVRYRLHYFDSDSTPHVVANVGAVSSLDWNVPEWVTPESGKTFRITAFDGADAKLGESWLDGTFNVVANPYVMTAPSPGVTWNLGVEYTISWGAHPEATRYNIHYFDADGTPHKVAKFVTGTTIDWTVPYGTSVEDGKQLRVTAFNAVNAKLGEAWLQGTFNVGPAFAMTAPSGGEVWALNSTQTIQWNAHPLAVCYNLHYFDADNTPHTVALLGDVASYEWTVPANATIEAGKQLRVTAFDGADVKVGEAWSAGTFEVVP